MILIPNRVMIGQIICLQQLLHLPLSAKLFNMKSGKSKSKVTTEKKQSEELRDFKERKDAETKVLEKLLTKINSNPSLKDTK